MGGGAAQPDPPFQFQEDLQEHFPNEIFGITFQLHSLTRIIHERFCCKRRCLTQARRAG
jgi:hypothetical protein